MMIYGAYSYDKFQGYGEFNDVTVGKFCSIAADAKVDCGIGHRTDVISTFPFDALWHGISGDPRKSGANTGTVRGPIVIGNDVWIGQGAMIMSGVTIGDGAVVGIRSVVVRDVPPYAIVSGIPALKWAMRFPPDIVEKLLMVKWWDWPEEKLRKHSRLLVTNNFEELWKVAGI